VILKEFKDGVSGRNDIDLQQVGCPDLKRFVAMLNVDDFELGPIQQPAVNKEFPRALCSKITEQLRVVPSGEPQEPQAYQL
jgi:hypothetical protein